ncbi:MAG: hypothetical protein AAGC60_01950 [Acidobacteriota bacterium]
MSEHRMIQASSWWMAVCALCVVACLFASPLVAQDDSFGAEDEATVAEEEVDFSEIDDLLAMDDEVMNDPGVYSYEPGARRDPFRSLLQRKDLPEDVEPERPEGVAGLLIDEIEIEGILMLEGAGPVAQVQTASADISYLLRPGDELWDGDVVRITLDEVVFKQEDRDPGARKPFREVVKRLNP